MSAEERRVEEWKEEWAEGGLRPEVVEAMFAHIDALTTRLHEAEREWKRFEKTFQDETLISSAATRRAEQAEQRVAGLELFIDEW